MLTNTFSAATVGIDARLIEIETDIQRGLPKITIVGLPDTAIKESKDRVKSAIKNSQFEYPAEKITINLAPCDLKKEGPSFDLPIAIGILSANRQIARDRLKDFIFLGELSLNGVLRPVKGVLPVIMSLKNLGKKIILPEQNAHEAVMAEGIDIYPARTLHQVCGFLNNQLSLSPVNSREIDSKRDDGGSEIDFLEVKGQRYAKRAMEIAASGNHNIIMIGPPGSGKTMLAKRLPTIMPKMTREESIESTKIHSISGLITGKESLIIQRPFRSPHHTSSYASLVGGGTIPRPGEISLAHNGILFLDELPEFQRNALEALRQPLEEGHIIVSRTNGIYKFPSKFMLACSMNPCPCGYFTDPKKECHCTPPRIQKYMSKISGPLLDRIDIHIEVPPVRYKELTEESMGESSEDIKKRVENTRDIQAERFREQKGIYSNSQMNHGLRKKHCKLNEKCKRLLKKALTEMGFSARCYDKILKISRTIADMAQEPDIQEYHIAEAIQYRSLDRNAWI